MMGDVSSRAGVESLVEDVVHRNTVALTSVLLQYFSNGIGTYFTRSCTLNTI